MRTALVLGLVTTLLATACTAPPVSAEEEDDDGPTAFAIFFLLQATPRWLALSPDERFAFLDAEIQGRLAAHPAVRTRFWDTEHWNARVSDVLLFETQDLGQYQSLVEGLRETKFWGHYFEVIEILPGAENAYARHYDREAYGSDQD